MRIPYVYIFILATAFCGVVGSPATADWLNLSGAQNAPNIAEIHINDDHVKIELEIFVKNLVTFDRLIPDDFFTGTPIKRPPLDERMRQFSSEDLQIVAENGQPLQATLKLIEPRLRRQRPMPMRWRINPYTGQPIPGPPQDKRVLYAELTYPFRQKPKALTIVPPLDEQRRMSQVPIGFMTYHQGVPLHDFKYLSEPSTVTLDWADPWYSKYAKKVLQRWQLGGVMSFLYIDPYEVRHEILARVKDLAAWMDLGLRGSEFIELDENDPLKERVGAFFLKRDRTLIDGRKLRPILDRVSFVKYSTTASVFVEQPEKLPINTAMVGVIITYVTEGLPQQVTSEWHLWSERVQQVATDAIDPVGGLPSYITPDDNILVWNNFLKTYQIPTVAKIEVDETLTSLRLPLASVLCLMLLLPAALLIRKRRQEVRPIGLLLGLSAIIIAGSVLLYPFFKVAVAKPSYLAPKMTAEQAEAILNSLLKNIYRSFDFREETDVYDRLATSVSGDLLSEIYLQNRRSMVVKQAGGAQARVKEVEILDVAVGNVDGHPLKLLFQAEWTATGKVGHWGHLHIRKNQYEANITVEPVDGAWKITDLELLEEKRIDPYA
jgi:hypothetical protein